MPASGIFRLDQHRISFEQVLVLSSPRIQKRLRACTVVLRKAMKATALVALLALGAEAVKILPARIWPCRCAVLAGLIHLAPAEEPNGSAECQ